MLRYFVTLLFLMVVVIPVKAQDDSCYWRPTNQNQPWIKAGISCIEEVINIPEAGELAFTALAVAPDGTLFAARPMAGQVWAFTDSDGDGLPESPRMVAQGLTLPNGLDFHDGALYIAGGAHIYRLRGDELVTLVDDLPSGGGFWTGGIAVGDDGRLYVSTGAPCDFCAVDDPARGAILSFTLEGGDRQIVATGLRQPADLAFYNGNLYVVDSARTGLFDQPDLDELNRVETGANFGFPHCVGLGNAPDLAGGDCAAALPPVIALPTGSTPIGLAAYRGDAIPSLQNKLLLVLSGSYNDLDLRGYQIVAADVAAGTYEPMMPNRPDDSPAGNFTIEEMNYRGSGFFPRRPLDAAVSEQGWVYISISGGRILLLRP